MGVCGTKQAPAQPVEPEPKKEGDRAICGTLCVCQVRVRRVEMMMIMTMMMMMMMMMMMPRAWRC